MFGWVQFIDDFDHQSTGDFTWEKERVGKEVIF